MQNKTYRFEIPYTQEQTIRARGYLQCSVDASSLEDALAKAKEAFDTEGGYIDHTIQGIGPGISIDPQERDYDVLSSGGFEGTEWVLSESDREECMRDAAVLPRYTIEGRSWHGPQHNIEFHDLPGGLGGYVDDMTLSRYLAIAQDKVCGVTGCKCTSKVQIMRHFNGESHSLSFTPEGRAVWTQEFEEPRD